MLVLGRWPVCVRTSENYARLEVKLIEIIPRGPTRQKREQNSASTHERSGSKRAVSRITQRGSAYCAVVLFLILSHVTYIRTSSPS